MRNRDKLLIFLLCFLVGYSLSKVIIGLEPTSSNIITTPRVIYEYSQKQENLKIQEVELNDQIQELEDKLELFSTSEKIDYEVLENELFNELTKYDIITRKMDIGGSGVEIIISDSEEEIAPGDNINNYIIHNSNILKIVNELKYAGAETIAINGYQLSWNSNIDCAGPVIYIDDFIAGTPFRVQAIGDPVKMNATLLSDNSYYMELYRYSKININLVEKDNIILNKN